MASHTGWLEAGGADAPPTYTGNRKTAAWSAATAGGKALSAALAYAMTGTGTVKGAFLVYGTAALGHQGRHRRHAMVRRARLPPGIKRWSMATRLNVSYSTSL